LKAGRKEEGEQEQIALIQRKEVAGIIHHTITAMTEVVTLGATEVATDRKKRRAFTN